MGLKVKNIWNAALPAGPHTRTTINPGEVGTLIDGAEKEVYITEWIRKGRLQIVHDKEEITALGKLSPTKQAAHVISGKKVESGVVAVAPETSEVIERVEAKPAKTTITKVGNATLTTIAGEDEPVTVRAGDPAKTAILKEGESTVVAREGDEEPNAPVNLIGQAVTPNTITEKLGQLKSWKSKVQFIQAQVNDPETLKVVIANSRKGGVVERAAAEKLEKITKRPTTL